MGRRRVRGRPVDGILLLDKPQGISSNAALQQVKQIYFAQKAGHTGALDPLATGMLPICLGEATKFSQFLLESDKRYLVTAKLGVRTTTSDSDGEVVSELPVDVSEQQLLAVLDQFRGETQQIPSMYSALKYQGQPLYKYARAGVEVPRESRPITVYELDLIAFSGDEVTLDIKCSKGTYIRTIIDDMGEKLGCGAHVIMLRRTQVADYPAERMMTLEQLQTMLDEAREQGETPSERLDPLLLQADTAVQSLPEVNLTNEMADYILHGQAVLVPGISHNGALRLTRGDEQRFIGIGELNQDGLVAPKRLINQTDR